MEQRLKEPEKLQGIYRPLSGFNSYLAKSRIEKNLLDLIDFRVSQINGCAFCLDMHSKDLRAKGETEQRLYMMDAWREASIYSDRERAALGWAESVTLVTQGHIPDEAYNEVRQQFSEEEVIDLTLATLAINCWNRINVAFRTPSGDYQPGQFESTAKLKLQNN
jgi:AhpD family alkylhydroperoxidase